MLKVKEVKLKIFEGVKEYFNVNGFVHKKTNDEFVREVGKMKQIVFLSFTSFSSEILVRIWLYIKHKEIEDIYTKITGKKDYSTIGNEIGELFSSRNGRDYHSSRGLSFVLQEDDDIFLAIEDLKRYYENIMSPYFDKYLNLVELDGIFNNEPYDFIPVDIGSSPGSRASKGLIIARLLDKNIYDNLISIYDVKILKGSESCLKNYEKVKEYLKYNAK